jgi:two-component system sporulation sensor kinase C
MVIDSAVAKVVFRAEDGRIVWNNLAAEAMYGYPAGGMLGLPILCLTADPQATESTVRETVKHGKARTFRRWHQRRDGSKFYVHIGLELLEQGPETLIGKYVLEANAFGETERLLSESKERFRVVADYTYDWDSWLDLDGNLVWVNPAVEKLTGYAVADCLRMEDYPLSMIIPEDRPAIEKVLAKAREGIAGNDFEFRVSLRDGTPKWFAVSWQALLDHGSKPIGVRMSMRDIEDRKKIEEELRQYTFRLEELARRRAQTIVELEQKKAHMEKLAALGEMAASIAHEINNPLAGVKNAVRLVQDDNQLHVSSQELLQLVDKEIIRIGNLLQQMHQLCRPPIGTAERVSVNRLLDEVVDAVRAQCTPCRIVVERWGWPKELWGWICEAEFRQILHNLVLNAFEASSDKGRVELGCVKLADDQLVLQVVDHGVGIDGQSLPHIFEPFFTTKHDSRRSGTGLGLAISRSLVLAIGGTIEVSPTVGGGATFTVKVPMKTEASPVAEI